VRTTYSLRCEKLGQSMARGHLPKIFEKPSPDTVEIGFVGLRFSRSCARSFHTVDGSQQHGGQRLQESHLLQLPQAASTPTTSSSPFRPAWGSSDSINRTLSCEIRPSRGCASSIEISPVLNGMGPLELVYCMMYLNAHTSSQKTQPGRN
jgi:hypothetical protein